MTAKKGILMSNNLRNRASKNFEKYLNEFLNTGETVGLPAARLNDTEWKQLNAELYSQGVTLIPSTEKGVLYYWFSKSKPVNDLRNRASKNFEKYLNEFLTDRKNAGLPGSRLTQEEWTQLNKSLLESGVQLVPYTQDGRTYYWFTEASKPMDKISIFAHGREKVENKLIEIIQQKYPNLSTNTILNILRSENPTNDNMIYRMLRYKQDGQYTDVSQQEFEDAFNYARTSCSKKYSNGRYLNMHGWQHWTWFRFCGGNTEAPAINPKNPNGFHISLNVRVTKDLLKILDDFLIKDGGKYIHSYKFPKTNFYNEILSRHDPVTIYTNARNPELEKQIANAIQPFVRSNDGLIGDMLGKGISISPETSNANSGISVGQAVSMNIANIIRQHGDNAF